MLSVCKVEFLGRFVAIFGKKNGSFSLNILGRFFLSKSLFGNFKNEKTKQKKVPTTTKGGGGGIKASVVGPLEKDYFLRLP